MVKVKELMSVHEYPEPLVLAVDLDLQDGQTEGRTEGGREGGKEKQRRGGGGTDETTELQ